MTPPKKGRVFLIAISAIPGAGKTSAIKRFKETGALENALKTQHNLEPRIVFVREPEDMWIEQVNGKEYHWLREFYKDRDMNAHPFQMLVFHTHVEVVERARDTALADSSYSGSDVLLIVERSMYDQLLFWKLQVDDKLASTSAIHDSSYMKIWSRWNQFIPQVSLVFFFHTSNLQGTMKRLRKREALKRSVSVPSDRSVFHLSNNSDEEIEEADGIPLAYQEALLRKHEEWYTTPQTSFPKEANGQIPCVKINVDAPYHEEDAHLHQLAEEMARPIARILRGDAI